MNSSVEKVYLMLFIINNKFTEHKKVRIKMIEIVC